VTNSSDDIFVGLDPTLLKGNVINHEYIQVDRGYGVGLDQTFLLEATIASGNGKHTFSWYIYSLGHHFNFFQTRLCYCTIVGIYFSTLVTVLTVYVSIYGHLYLILNGHEKQVGRQENILHDMVMKVAPAT